VPLRVQLIESSEHLHHAVDLLLALHDDVVLVGSDPDVVLVDLRRPLGRAFRVLRHHAATAQVVALAGDRVQARAALAHGASEAVVKSDGAMTFLATLRRVAAAGAPALAA
jgi:DNA-binding NarL/FixJ family response regulator